MKKLKILTSVLLVLVLALSFCMPSFAAEEWPQTTKRNQAVCSVTIKSEDPTLKSHTYIAYQIFTADLYKKDASSPIILSDIDFTEALKEEEGLYTALDEILDLAAHTPEAVTDALKSLENGSKEIQQFASVLYDQFLIPAEDLDEEAFARTDIAMSESGANEGEYVINNLTPGYYLIIDKEKAEDDRTDDDIYSKFILNVVGDVTVTTKTDLPKINKILGKAVTPTEEESGEIQTTIPLEERDYNITETGMNQTHNTANKGDIIPFKIYGNFPDLEQYSEYKYEITDTLSEGLTFNNDVTIKIVDVQTSDSEGTEVTNETLVRSLNKTSEGTSGEFSVTSYETGHNIVITIDKIKALYDEYLTNETVGSLVGKRIVVEYTATLNDKANANKVPNTNVAFLTYTNNPRTLDEGTTTPEITYTYTFNVTLNKAILDEYKKAGNGSTIWTETTAEYKEHNLKTNTYLNNVVFDLYKDGETTPIKTDLTTANTGKVELGGLAAGTYYLVETQACEGYNKVLGKIQFSITPNSFDAANKIDEMTLVSSIELHDGLKDTANHADIGTVPAEYDGANEIYLLVTNSQGLQLPSTGGIGTVIFTVVGLLVMATVAVIAVKSNKESK